MQHTQAALVAFQSSDMRGRPSICIRCRQAGRGPELMQRTQAAHVPFHSSEMRGRHFMCTHRRQAGRRPELMQRTQAVHVPFHSSEMRGRPSIFIRGHEVAKRKIANDFVVSPFLQHIVLRNPFP
eukprot:jgi/Chrpa1/17416/Chrysochromulina_OHIO_Genome00019701-RA